MRECIITLELKSQKAILFIDNLHPITLLNNDYTILSSVLAKQSGLDGLIDECQSLTKPCLKYFVITLCDKCDSCAFSL